MAIFAKIDSLQGATFGIQFKSPEAGNFLPFSPLHAFLAIFAKIANFATIAIFAKIASLQGSGTFITIIASPLAIFAKIANFAKIAIFAKIASLQGATFGIQFKSPEAGDFSPVSPFSPLHAFLDISASIESKVSLKIMSQVIKYKLIYVLSRLPGVCSFTR